MPMSIFFYLQIFGNMGLRRVAEFTLRTLVFHTLLAHSSCGAFRTPIRTGRQPATTSSGVLSASPDASLLSLRRRDFLLVATTTAGLTAGGSLPLFTSKAAAASSSAATAASATGTGTAVTTRLQEAVGGAVSGSVLSLTKVLVKHPLDTVAVRLQTTGSISGRSPPARVGQEPLSPSFADGLSRRALLFRGLFRGIVPPLIFAVPSGAVFFGVKDFSKATLRDLGSTPGQNSARKWLASREGSTLVSVLVAQFPYWAVRNPAELIKTRAQAALELDEILPEGDGIVDEKRSVLDITRAAVDEEGLAALWRGYGENILYAYPADALKFVIYEALTTRGRTGGSGGKAAKVPPLEAAAVGALATAIAQAMTTPLDLVRNRVMVSSSGAPGTDDTKSLLPSSSSLEESPAPSYLGILSGIAREEGLAALWTGTLPRVGKAIISGAVQFGSYEFSKSSMTDFFSRKK